MICSFLRDLANFLYPDERFLVGLLVGVVVTGLWLLW